MKAIVISQIGGPEVLQYVDVPTPCPSGDEVLVKAHSIGVCMPETAVRQGIYKWMPRLPTIPGIEMSGTVVQTGPAVRHLRVGQPVFVTAREFEERAGCYAEYVKASEERVYPVPEDVDLEQVAGLANYQVAWHLLNSALNGARYESVLVMAAAGGVGTALVQLAKADGKRVIGVVSSEARGRFVLEQGADAVIDRTREDIVARVHELTDGKGVDLVLTVAGGRDMLALFDCLDRFGMLILYGRIGGPPQGDLAAAVERMPARALAYRYFSIHTLDDWPELRRRATHDLIQKLKNGVIRVPIYDRIPLAQASRAHQVFESGQVVGKLIMKP
ncbi:Quinone oxidoreductase 1 [Pigmentiphaga humi]|uniref:Quinone oxidoreductase 1 n=1 Tax=Pigmentiphaga humi TaxID=2478468 RepID=A0A3P4AWF4_9BURK|nr:zinc-dependent alcohol dehydrogenase family protein [Pigmentiphaga humi]VCU68384.1 Quinone oxidoreductase 1 [Pigmentiphaga humi]